MELVNASLSFAVGIFLITVIISMAILVCSRIFLQIKHQHKQMSSSGVPYPPAEFFNGNAKEMIREGSIAKHRKWISTYSTMCRVYYGASHHILLTDLAIIKDILDKHFKSFDYKVLCDKNDGHLLSEGTLMGCFCTLNVNWMLLEKKYQNNLPLTNGISYSDVSTTNMEQMVLNFNGICDQLLEEVTDHVRTRSTANVSKIFNQFALQSSMTLFLGKKINIIEGERDELSHVFLKLAARIKQDNSITSLSILTSHFPVFKPLLKYTMEKKEEWKNFTRAFSIIKRIVKVRRFYHRVLKYEDTLNLLLENNFNKDIDDEELSEITFGLFLSTYLLMSNILTYTAYLLAVNPDKQNKLITEINEFFIYNEDGSLYEASQSIEYLDWVVQESYRLYTPNAWTTMHCTGSAKVGNGQISKGTTVVLPIQAFHQSSDYWERPTTFSPERFSANGGSSSSLAFVGLPGNISNELIEKQIFIGVKMALVVILTYLKFIKSSATMVPLKTDTQTIFGNIQVPVDCIYLNIETNRISYL